MGLKTNTNGISQTDVIVREAIKQGLRDLRANPDLLDYCFAGLPNDAMTADRYGEATVQRAKKWFLATDIPVKVDVQVSTPKFPLVVITLQSSTEEADTLGQIHYDPVETMQDPWPPICNAFAVTSYDPDTGIVVIPDAVADRVALYTGMTIVDAKNRPFSITEVQAANTFVIDPAVADFSSAVLKYRAPQNLTTLESSLFTESYAVGCYAQGEPETALLLTSIVLFILLRYKQAYLEARGFEKTTIQVGGFGRSGDMALENVFTRVITITGSVRHYWPKILGTTLQGISLNPLVIEETAGLMSPADLDLDQAMWQMDGDILQGVKT